MKTCVFFCAFVLCLSYNGTSQTQIMMDSLSIPKSLGFQQTASYGLIDIKFKAMISDSRCPKNVTCIRAGEAKVIVSVFKDGTFIKDQELIIDASGYLIEEVHTFFSTEDFKMMAFGLSPYPDGATPIPKEAYKLNYLIKPSKI